MARRYKTPLGLRIPEGVALDWPAGLQGSVDFLLLGEGASVTGDSIPDRVLHQVTSVASAMQAIDSGASALIAKGQECAGRVGQESTFVLLQRVLKLVAGKQIAGKNIPVFAQGGIGFYTGTCRNGGRRSRRGCGCSAGSNA